MNPNEPIGNWVLGVGLTAVVSLFGFLAKKAFSDVTEQLHGMTGKLDTLITTQAQGDTRMAVLENQVTTCIEELDKVREKLHAYGNHITNLQARMSLRTTTGSFPAASE